ncbi:MAG: Flp family type IVb pilin [Synergistaceae bacterium]|jgi:pilus assembly protein Flp/PilA|nr:Flp family type IVb pilin [Synergistaceae bacterium]
MMKKLIGLARDEEGQGMVEYGLIIAVIAVALVAALVTLRGGISGVFQNASDQMSSNSSGS